MITNDDQYTYLQSHSVPQVTRFLLADQLVSSKANPCSGSKNQKRVNVESQEQ